MKTLRSCAPASSPSQLLWRLPILLGISALLLATSTEAAVTPLPVPDSGLGPLHFDTLPGLADGWASISIPAGNSAPNTVAAMDTLANTNAAAGIVTALTTDTTGSTPTAPFGASGVGFRWNSVDRNLESRPTGIAYQVLLLALRNSKSSDAHNFILDYDFGALFPPGALETEDDNNLLAGFRVYYSLTGLPGSWTHIPDLDGGRATAGNRAAIVNLPSPWAVGETIYIMWTDDNAVTGSGGNGPGSIEGPYTIDNVFVSFVECPPLGIITPPQNTSVESCRTTNLSVVATGFALHYQWFHQNIAIPGNDSLILNIPQATLADAGDYFVRITNVCSPIVAISPNVTLTVTPDSDPPTVVSALALSDGLTYKVSFSELMDRASLVPEFFAISPIISGTVLYITNVIIAANGRDITLQSDTPCLPNVNYELIIQGPVVLDCSQNPLGNDFVTVPLEFEVVLMAIESTPWKYDHSGVDLGLNWIAPNYDASAWSNRLSVFDAKNTGPRAFVGGQVVMTDLDLHNAAYPADDIPVYYFRSSFTLPVPISDVMALHLRTFVDDFVVVCLNGDPNPAYNGLINGADADPLRYGYSGGNAVGDANFLGPIPIDLSKLVDGQNLVAAKVFQQTNTSSDITFALELTAVIKAFPAGPKLAISIDQATSALLLTWPSGTSSQLYEATQIDATGIGGPAGWNLVSSATDGSFTINPAGAGGVQKFYSLRK